MLFKLLFYLLVCKIEYKNKAKTFANLGNGSIL